MVENAALSSRCSPREGGQVSAANGYVKYATAMPDDPELPAWPVAGRQLAIEADKDKGRTRRQDAIRGSPADGRREPYRRKLLYYYYADLHGRRASRIGVQVVQSRARRRRQRLHRLFYTLTTA